MFYLFYITADIMKQTFHDGVSGIKNDEKQALRKSFINSIESYKLI